MLTKKLLLLSYVLAAISLGCLPVMSLHPLYDEKNLIFEEKLLGTWLNADDPNDPNSNWQFKRSDSSKKEYELAITDDKEKKGIFTAKLVQLDALQVLDIYPDGFPSGKDTIDDTNLPYNAFFFMPVHTFVKVDFIKSLTEIDHRLEPADANELRRLSKDCDYMTILKRTNSDEFEKLMAEDPNAVQHQKVKGHGIVLTASTKQLQQLVLKYADDERLFNIDSALIRKKNHTAKEPAPEANKATTKSKKN